MPDVRFTVLFCDELSREESGQFSLIRLYAPLVIIKDPGPIHVTTVAFVRGAMGADLSSYDLSVNYSVDGGRDARHSFPPLPSIEIAAKAAGLVDKAAAVREELGFCEGQLVGALQIEGIEFEKTCVFTAELNGEKIWRSVFVRESQASPRVHKVRQSEKVQAKAPAKRTATRKAAKKRSSDSK